MLLLSLLVTTSRLSAATSASVMGQNFGFNISTKESLPHLIGALLSHGWYGDALGGVALILVTKDSC